MPVRHRITTRQHASVRRCRRLATGPDDGRVLLDGEHLIREALAAGISLDVLLTDEHHAALAAQAERSGAVVHPCTRGVLEAASPVRTPSGILAIAAWQPAALDAVFDSSPALVAGLVDVQDPGNTGAVIRSADALGATGVLALGATADPASWKVLRGAMGSTFRLPVARSAVAPALADARRRGIRVLATVATGGRRPADIDFRAPALVLFGHEGLGLSDEVRDAADGHVSIRMRPGVDSLNIAVAAALILDEARRQRETTSGRP